MVAAGNAAEAITVSAGLKRAAVALPATFILCFGALKLAPAGPFSTNPGASAEALPRIREAFDADATIWTQMARYAFGVIRGDFGPSMRTATYSVGEVIDETIGWTLVLVALGLALAAALAWCLAVLDRRIGGAASVALDLVLAAVAATPALLIAWSALISLNLIAPDFTGLVFYLVLPPAVVGLPAGVAFHFLRRQFESAGDDPVAAVAHGFSATLPLLLLMVILAESAHQRNGIGYVLLLVAQSGDVIMAAGMTFCFLAIGIVLDFGFTLLLARIAKSRAAYSSDRIAFEPRESSHAFPRMTKARSVIALTLFCLIGALFLVAAVSGKSADDSDFEALELVPSFSNGHLLGTDDLGRDHLAVIAASAETSLGTALLVGLAVTAIGAAWVGSIRGLRGFGRKVLRRLADGLSVLPWPALGLCFGAAGMPTWAALAVAVNSAPIIARIGAAQDRTVQPRQHSHPAFGLLVVAVLTIAYAVIGGTGFELGQFGPMVPEHSIGNFLILNVARLESGTGWLAFLVAAALPMVAVAGLIQLSGAAADRPLPVEDPYARVF